MEGMEGLEEGRFLTMVDQFKEKNEKYLCLLKPSLSPPQLCFLLNSLKEAELGEILEILNMTSPKCKDSKVKLIFESLCLGEYTAEREKVDFDQDFVEAIRGVMHPCMPRSMISLFNRKLDAQVIQRKLQQEIHNKHIKIMLKLVGYGSTYNKVENSQHAMNYLRPPMGLNTRKRKNESDLDLEQPKKLAALGKYEIRTYDCIVPSQSRGEVSRGTIQKENGKGKDEKQVLWESFERKILEKIEKDISNKTEQLEQTKKERDQKMNELEQISSALEEDRRVLANRHIILGQLGEKFNFYLENKFVTPFDFGGEYRQLEFLASRK